MAELPGFLTTDHPIVECSSEMWETNERRMRGGPDIITELRPFDWETVTEVTIVEESRLLRGEELSIQQMAEILATSVGARPGLHYKFRQSMAPYLNFPEMFATTTNGALMGRRPVPQGDLQFGTLGNVRRRGRSAKPTRAELMFFNADGVGNDGSQWDNYWAGAMRRAMATGHRWIYVGFANGRPYLTDFSPLAVVNYAYEAGALQWIVFLIPARHVQWDEKDGLQGNEGQTDYLLMTKRGFKGFGAPFNRGGWWQFNQDAEIVDNGNWRATGGEIPAFPLFFQRDYPTLDKDRKWHHSFSKPATTELGNMAIGYMNLSSAADFDAWDAAASIQFLRGVDSDGFELAMKYLRMGSKYVPLPAVIDTEGHSSVPIAQDTSMGAVTAAVFDMALKRKLDEVARLAVTQATQAPDSSGLSKSAGFAEAKVPRLALMASELEAAQNTALYFIERRWGEAEPSGQVVWTRKFNLVQLSEDIEAYFNLEKLAGMRSKTLDSKALVLAAREKGLLVDDDTDGAKILQEFLASALLADVKAKETEAGVTGAPTTPSGRGLSGAEPAAEEILSGAGADNG